MWTRLLFLKVSPLNRLPEKVPLLQFLHWPTYKVTEQKQTWKRVLSEANFWKYCMESSTFLWPPGTKHTAPRISSTAIWGEKKGSLIRHKRMIPFFNHYGICPSSLCCVFGHLDQQFVCKKQGKTVTAFTNKLIFNKSILIRFPWLKIWIQLFFWISSLYGWVSLQSCCYDSLPLLQRFSNFCIIMFIMPFFLSCSRWPTCW